jgi:hypothetical protein
MVDFFSDFVTLKEVIGASAAKTIVVPATEVPIVGKTPIAPITRDTGDRLIDIVEKQRQVAFPLSREQLNVPITSHDRATDEVLYEAANDASQKYYLPRYQLAEEIVSGERRYRIATEREEHNWRFVVYLQAYPAASLEIAARTAHILPHTAQVILQENQQEWLFQEVTAVGNTLKAVLRLRSLEERDELYQVLTDPDRQTLLKVNRQTSVAIPSPYWQVALYLPEAISYANIAASAASRFNFTQALTLEAWVRLENPELDQKIVGKSQIGNGYVLGIIHRKIYAEFWDRQGKRYVLQAGNLQPRTWTHIAVTWQRGDRAIAYINGREVGHTSASPELLGISLFPLVLGAAPWNTRQWQTIGWLKEVRIWSQARTGQQIQATMQQQLTGQETGLVGNWVASAATGTTLRDRTPNGHHASLHGKAQWGQTPAVYQQITERLAQIVDRHFFFPPILHEYIFTGLQPNIPSHQGFKRFTVSWQGRDHAYFQSASDRHQVYYIPDQFEIGTRIDSPTPTMSLQFSSPNGSLASQQAKLSYYATPVVVEERLVAASQELRRQFPTFFPTALANINFTPLHQTAGLRFELHVPRHDGATPLVSQDTAQISLRDGILHTLTLSLPDFQAIWDALFATRREQALFTGQVIVELEGFFPETIPFLGRLREEPARVLDAILDLTQSAMYSKTITVKGFSTLFESLPDTSPDGNLLAILVDFERGDTVELNPQQLEVQSQVSFPLTDIVLRREESGTYRYKRKAIRQYGNSEDQDWRETNFDILYPDADI